MAPLQAPILPIPGETDHQQQHQVQQQPYYTGQLQKKQATEGSVEWYFDQGVNWMGDHPWITGFGALARYQW